MNHHHFHHQNTYCVWPFCNTQCCLGKEECHNAKVHEAKKLRFGMLLQSESADVERASLEHWTFDVAFFGLIGFALGVLSRSKPEDVRRETIKFLAKWLIFECFLFLLLFLHESHFQRLHRDLASPSCDEPARQVFFAANVLKYVLHRLAICISSTIVFAVSFVVFR